MKPLALFSVAVLSAHAQLSVPQLGIAHYSDGSVRIVRGISANFIVDSHLLAAADAASFSDISGLVSANGLIRLLRSDGSVIAEYQTGEPAPLLQAGTVAWLPSRHSLLRWDGLKFTETPVDDSSFTGAVTFVNLPTANTAQFFVTRTDSSVARISVALPSGRVTSSDSEPAARGWVVVQQGWTVFQDEWGLVAERPNGNRQTIQLSSAPIAATDLHVEQMSSHWVHVSSSSSGTNWALYLDNNKVDIFLLPPPPTGRSR